MALAPFKKIAYGPPIMAHSIVIYQDEGVGEFGLKCLQRFFANDVVTLVTAEDVIIGTVFKDADIFVMPGGADLPYCRKLNSAGNRNIRAFVGSGGTYLGICAGAYYACREIEFHKGRDDEICGSRELALVDAIAVGSLPELAPHYDLTAMTATIAQVQMMDGQTISAFYHGGPKFITESGDMRILGSYRDMNESSAAVVSANFGKGHVLLTGLHIEASASDLCSFPQNNEDERNHIDRLSEKLSKDTNPQDLLRELLKSIIKC